MTDATTPSGTDPGAALERLLATLVPAAGSSPPTFAAMMQALATAMHESPASFEAILVDLYREQQAFWQRWLLAPTAATDTDDAASASDQPPFFAMVDEQYAIWRHWADRLSAAMPGDDPQSRRLRFLLRQWIAAAAPRNFIGTNPAAVEAASATDGASLSQGLERARADARVGRVTLSNGSDFVVGRTLASTSGAVVLDTGVMQLIQYLPRRPRVASRPLVMVPPFINKFYILDLRPGRSLVEWALDHGQQVFMISWRNGGDATRNCTWEDLVRQGVMAAVEAALDITRADRANVLGYCAGGTVAACAAGLDAAAPSPVFNSLTLLATLLDYTDPGDIGVYIDEAAVADVERRVGRGGIVPAATVANAFASLRPGELVWDPVVHHYLMGQLPPASDLLYWNDDGTDLPGPLYAWYLRQLYLENRLRIPNAVRIGNAPIDLGAVRVPVYALAAEADHIVPWRAAFESTRLLGGTVRFVLGENGHVGGVINPAIRGRYGYRTPGRSATTAESWLDHSQHNRGSWWHDWIGWLEPLSGRTGVARKRPGNRKYRPIEEAPGRFVLERAAPMGNSTA